MIRYLCDMCDKDITGKDFALIKILACENNVYKHEREQEAMICQDCCQHIGDLLNIKVLTSDEE